MVLAFTRDDIKLNRTIRRFRPNANSLSTGYC